MFTQGEVLSAEAAPSLTQVMIRQLQKKTSLFAQGEHKVIAVPPEDVAGAKQALQVY